MKPGPVHGGRHDNGEAAQQFVADTDSGQNIVAGTAAALGGGEGGGNDNGAGMDRRAFEGIVVIFAVGGGAVDQRGAGHVQPLGVSDGGDAAAFRGGTNRQDVIQVPCRQAQPGDIEQ